MNIEVNYKNKKRYKTSKYPIRQPKFFTGLILFLSWILTRGKKIKIVKNNMEDLKSPYMLLSNHMSFIDFEFVALGTKMQRVNSVVNIDGFNRRAWLLRWIGSIATRKFTNDLHLVKSIRKVFLRGDVLAMYPEARYSACGITSYLPDSLGSLIKMSKVPVVVVIHHGNHLFSPFWNFRKKRKVPFLVEFNKVLTPEQINNMSVSEINDVIRNAFKYDDYKYQLDNNILIKEKFRAEGLHRILYQCPHCHTEFKMSSKGTNIFCTECGKNWHMNENGTLSALDGETEFAHIPDWYLWERENVKREIEEGKYYYEDVVDVFGEPRTQGFVALGKAKITHDAENGWIIEGHHNNSDYRIHRKPLQINSLHVEYDYFRIRRADCFDISTENDSFYCYPTHNNVTKLAFATEIIYLMHEIKIKK